MIPRITIRKKRLQISEEKRNVKIALIENKWKDRIPLTEDEKIFACDNLRFDNLLLYPFCIDEFFSRSFLRFQQLNDRQLIYYQGLINEWDKEINRINHPDPTLQIVAKETREELKKIRKEDTILFLPYQSSKYFEKKFKILEWSKYRYLIDRKSVV